MKYCTTCNLDYPGTSSFCKACGRQLSDKVTSSLPSPFCESCGAQLQSTWRFCQECAHPVDEVTLVGRRTGSSLQEQTAVYAFPPTSPQTPIPQQTVASSWTPPIPPPPKPPKEEICRACGHVNAPGSGKCEACGDAVGSTARKLRAKKFAIVFLVIIAIVLALAGVAAAGWYMTGIKMAIQTDPGDAKIIIDGQEVGRTNAYGALTTGRIRSGTHNVIIKHDGYDEWKQAVTIAFTDFSKGLNIKLNITKYKITINSSPSGSEVLVDNTSIGTTSYENGTLEIPATLPGEHTVVVRHDGYHEWKQTVTLSGDLKLDVTLNLAPLMDESTGLAEDEIKSSLQGWAQSTSNRDVDSHMRYYSDTLDYYYNQTFVPSSKVREDRMKAFAKYNYVSVQLSNIGIQLDSTGQRATVVLDKTFDFRNDSGSFYSGSVQDQLTVTKLGGGWVITGEKELKVYYVNK